MSNIINTLASLAKGGAQCAEEKQFGIANLNPEIRAAMEDIAKEERTATVKAAAKEIVNIVSRAEGQKVQLIDTLRAVRDREAVILTQLREINAAEKHAATTSNYIPLAVKVGLLSIAEAEKAAGKELSEVPAAESGRKKVRLVKRPV